MKAALRRPLYTLATALRWIWSHKQRTSGYGAATLIGVYASVCMLVSCSSSPTTEQITLPNQQALAYNTHLAGDDQGGRVIFLHGAPADAKSWNKLLERADEIGASELIVVDRMGYGNSTSEDELTLAGHAASIRPFLDEAIDPSTVIVGHSYGGPVALRVAADYPDKVGGIVLVAGACDAYMRDAQWFRRSVDRIRLLVPEDWERANRELLALTDENRQMESLLGQVTCPVVIVHGTWDGVCPHESTVAYLQDRLVNADVRVVSINRAGHNLHLSHLDQVIEAINSIDQAE